MMNMIEHQVTNVAKLMHGWQIDGQHKELFYKTTQTPSAHLDMEKYTLG